MLTGTLPWGRYRLRRAGPVLNAGPEPRAEIVSANTPVRAGDSDPELSRRLASDVLASCPDPLFVVDANGAIEMANAAGADLFKRVGLAPDHKGPIQSALERVRILPGDGSPSPFNPPRVDDLRTLAASADKSIGEPVYDLRLTRRTAPENRPVGWILQLVDVTPLLSALRGQEAANRHRDGIVSLLSHDLRSPHAAILATLNHADFASVPANLRQIIERAARRSLHMVDSLVRSVRAECLDYRFEAIDLVHIFEEVADALWTRTNESGVKIHLQPGPDRYEVLADRGMLTRAITDVISSFVKFSAAGQPITCDLSASTLAGRPAVACEITGTVRQISDGELARIFSRFAASRHGDVGSMGDGDGLTFVRTVVARHEGALTCSELVGSRRSVSIVLPRADPPDEASGD